MGGKRLKKGEKIKTKNCTEKKSLYVDNPTGTALLQELRRKGMFWAEIANAIGVSPHTLYNWKNENKEWAKILNDTPMDGFIEELETIRANVARGKVQAVERFYEYKTNPETGKREKVLIKEVVKQPTPDARVAGEILKNEAPDRYAEKQEVTVSVEDKRKAYDEFFKKLNIPEEKE